MITTLSVNCVNKSHYICLDLEYLWGGLNELKHLNLGNTGDNTCFKSLEQVAMCLEFHDFFFRLF